MNSHILQRSCFGICTVLITLLVFCISASSQITKARQNSRHSLYKTLVRNALITKNTADNRHFQLRNGKYHKHYFTLELFDPIIFAYLNSDSIEYAIAPIELNGGGNGEDCSINVFVRHRDKAQQIAYADLDDRIQLDSIKISQNIISVYIVEREGTPKVLRFVFRNDSLVTVN
jgi:hypothetical protein